MSTRIFDPIVKDNALRILLEYSATTGAKWTAIRREILKCVGEDPSPSNRVLTRQDLESWASRRSQLGDQKFSLVLKFLESEGTKSRIGFKDVGSLFNPKYNLLRVGRVLGDTYGAGAGRRVLPVEKRGWRREFLTDEFAEVLAGLFVGRDVIFKCDLALYLHPVPGEYFLIAHVLRMHKRGALIDDWDMDRLSGFATIDTRLRLHVCNPQSRIWECIDVDVLRLNEQKLIYLHEITHEFFSGWAKHIGKLSYELERSDDKRILNIVENIIWNVPV